MEAEKASVSPALSQLSSLVKSPAAPAAATLPAPQAPASSAARTGHRRIQSSFPSAPGPETHGLSSSFNEGSLLEQRMRGEMPPPPVPAAGSHNRRHSVNVFAKNAGAGSGFGGVDQIPEDEAPPQPTHRRTGSRGGSSAFESGNWRSNSISGNNATLASGNVTDLASAQAQLASLAQFRAAAGGGHHRMASFALPNMLPNLLAATTLSAPAGTPDLWRQQQAFQLQLQQSSGTAPSGPQRKSLFAPYLPQASLPPLLQAGKLVVGILRVNKKNRSDAYVATDVLEADIYICGSKDRNRALEGDIVAVELLDVDEVWATKKDKEEKKRKKEENAAYDLKPSTRKQLEKKKDDVEVEGQGLLLVEEEEVSDEVKPMYAGHVVAVVSSPILTFCSRELTCRWSGCPVNSFQVNSESCALPRPLPKTAKKPSDANAELQTASLSPLARTPEPPSRSPKSYGSSLPTSASRSLPSRPSRRLKTLWRIPRNGRTGCLWQPSSGGPLRVCIRLVISSRSSDRLGTSRWRRVRC